jgi:hypothetical protein
MDIATRNTILELLPSELIAEILAMLDYRDLVSCMQVRRPFPLFFRNSALAAQSVSCSLHVTLAGVQAHFRSNRQILFTAISPRIRKGMHGRWPFERNVNR